MRLILVFCPTCLQLFALALRLPGMFHEHVLTAVFYRADVLSSVTVLLARRAF
jgi:hypothetical protein